MASKAEKAFKEKYPHAHIRPTDRAIASYRVIAVFAGDYLCAEGLTVRDAYGRAAEYDAAGLIQPDPEEQRTDDQTPARAISGLKR
jgi:DNA transposition AAA+ family ATPase